MSDRRVLEHFMLDARCMDNKNVYDMTLLDFYRQYPDEASCEAALCKVLYYAKCHILAADY